MTTFAFRSSCYLLTLVRPPSPLACYISLMVAPSYFVYLIYSYWDTERDHPSIRCCPLHLPKGFYTPFFIYFVFCILERRTRV
jgi:hypothetical protein